MLTWNLGRDQAAIDSALDQVRRQRIVERIWARDHTVWKPEPAEIADRLGWLQSPSAMRKEIPRLRAWAEQVRSQGIEHALLLGIGGSSLAPQVFSKVFGSRPGYPQLTVLDTTDPDAINSCCQSLDPERTLVIVSSKSGGTIETISLFKYFFHHFAEALGERRVSRHFVAITDPGSGLAEIAQNHGFGEIFLNDPNIGGRYAALSLVGLVPAALLGVDLEGLLERATAAATASTIEESVRLGVTLGELAKRGRDKLTLLLAPPLSEFGAWLEQLMAESTGKQGKGILPVNLEPIGPPAEYGQDRVFVQISLKGDASDRQAREALRESGRPWVELELADRMDLGAQLYSWMWAAATACQRLRVNPFDQPDVESAKRLARQFVGEYHQQGRLPEPARDLEAEGVKVYGIRSRSVGECVNALVRQATSGGYVAIHAYLTPAPETDAALQALRLRIRRATKLATTVGYGPSLLHSTGQLHKGDAGRGVFIQISAASETDVVIPAEPGEQAAPLGFGTLKQAQAWGDYQALRQAGRSVLRLHIRRDVTVVLGNLMRTTG